MYTKYKNVKVVCETHVIYDNCITILAVKYKITLPILKGDPEEENN